MKGTPKALPSSPSLAEESLPGQSTKCWGCGVKEGLWQQGLQHGSERTAWEVEGKGLWRLSAVQRCGEGAPRHPQQFTIGTLSFKLLFFSKSSFPEHQTPQTTRIFFELHKQIM